MQTWWINGTPCRTVDVTDRGLTYGDGLFETIAVRHGHLRFLGQHLERLRSSASRLAISLPQAAALVQTLAAAAAPVEHGVLKLIVSRGPGPRGYQIPADPVTTVAFGIATTEPRPSVPVAVRWCETMASLSPALAGMKTLGRLEQVLARAEWSDPAVAEGLMCAADGTLVGGTSSNVFVVRDGVLLTPQVRTAGVAGVMRGVVLAEASRAGIPCKEADLQRADVEAADELFLTNALTGLRPVARLAGRSLPAGTLTGRIVAGLLQIGIKECSPDY